MTRAHVGLLGPCFKTGRVDYRSCVADPNTPQAISQRIRATRSQSTAEAGPPESKTRTESRGCHAAGRSTVPQRLSPWGYNSPGSEDHGTYLPRGLVTAGRTGRDALPTRKVHSRAAGPTPSESRGDPKHCAGRLARKAEFRGPTGRVHPLASRRFHVLLNSLFKVLFNFPSRYLFAIGLVPVFSLRWSLPPTWGCIPKQPDS